MVKPWVAVLCAAASLTMVFEASADARIDPATALQRQLVDGRGVKIAQLHIAEPGTWRTTGSVEFGKGKAVAADVVYRDSKAAPEARVISFPDRWYRREYPRDKSLPDGKTWFLFPAPPNGPMLDCGPIELSHPATLKAVLRTATVKRPAGTYDKVRTTLYQGRITLGELYKANSAFRIPLDTKPAGKYAKIPVTWQIWLGKDQLVRRCRSSYAQPIIAPGLQIDERFPVTEDIRLSRWGTETDIQPPPDDQVTSYDDVDASE
ncbi:hypothetical protein ACFWYW_49980 [Nonomuraea sp. NPDC059023]|uniref:hypothetical protein n=1 Tax=unclassified Nonomuraea TaxID=2593643 RepID=UPI0036A8C4AA